MKTRDHTKSTTSRSALTITIAIGLTGVGTWAAPNAHAEVAVVPVEAAEVSSELTGIVEIVNTERRMLTIKTPDGRFQVIHVPEAATRLDEIRIGNRLTITETDAILIDLVKGAGEGAVGTTQETTLEQEGGPRPAGTLTDTLTLYGRIVAIDRANQKVSVRGAEETREFEVADPALMKELAVGDGVVATFIRSVSGKIEVR
jgi:Cu/Ag efflux protein CusF